jgi:aryl-alcohol dehydrogenase-like predicted oxidoreductase
MEYTPLGKSGMKVSRLCLGTMNFGPRTEEKEAHKIMDAALAAGVNFFDTANVYGGQGKRGWTEEIIGRWFAKGGDRRERVVLATKVYGPMEDERDGPNKAPGLSAYKIRRHLKESLARLQTDHVELYQMHHIDRTVTWQEIWGVFESFVENGTVYYVGSSNFAGWDIARAQEAADLRGFLGLISEQHKYNLMCREPELEVLPSAEFYGLGVIPYSPIGGGILGGKALDPEPGSRSAREGTQKTVEENRDRIEKYYSFCADLGHSPANVALAWLLSHSAVAAPIIGPRTLEHLESALAAVEIELSDEHLAALDEIFPGPGKPAPEAYAW